MDPIAWLRQRLAHFPTPEQEELLKAITDFALLWSFFEATALATWATLILPALQRLVFPAMPLGHGARRGQQRRFA